jgi:hypothetical protein
MLCILRPLSGQANFSEKGSGYPCWWKILPLA